jgi:hypothetical protein
MCLDSTSSSRDSADDNTNLQSLGRLMNESQTSCAQIFECSCPELDELTRLAREAGAYGSRLTGSCFKKFSFNIGKQVNPSFLQVPDGAATQYH